MGFMQRVKVMLGLADEYEDEPYEDDYAQDDEYASDDAYADDSGDLSAPPSLRYTSQRGPDPASVRRVSREPDLARARQAAPLRAVPQVNNGGAPAPQVRIHTVEARSYAEAQSIADKFKAGQPVIINLSSTDPELAKRLLDFASGLTYGLDGGLQKVSERVFMLSPRNVDVSAAGTVRSRTSNLFGD
jgi:cell division inhibitor SepF